MPKIKYTRQSSIIDIEDYRDTLITIVGCGAIGSFTAISLAKMGLTRFTIFDMDTVEIHNLPNQFFTVSDIGKNKTHATEQHMKSFNDECQIIVHDEFTKNSPVNSHIVISCVDKMDVRKLIFEKCKSNKNVQLFIDTRMGGLQGQVYTIDMNNKDQIKYYETTLFDNKQAVQLRCTERSIIFTVLGVASIVCNQIVKAFNKEQLKNYIVLDYKEIQMFG